MEENKTEMALVTQLPIIKNHFKEISKDVSNRLKKVMSLAVTEESLADAKKVRADFNKEFANYEEIRKQIKREILKPYEQFEEEYKENIANLFETSDKYLKEQISFHEQEIKSKKEEDLRCYFNELVYSENLQDLITLDQLGVKVGLSDTMNKLRKEVKEKFDLILSDIQIIKADEHSKEILTEYFNCLDYREAKMKVLKRYADAEKIRERMEELDISLNIQEIPVEPKIHKPVALTIDEETFTTRFEVTTTVEKLKALKEYLNENNIGFKNI